MDVYTQIVKVMGPGEPGRRTRKPRKPAVKGFLAAQASVPGRQMGQDVELRQGRPEPKRPTVKGFPGGRRQNAWNRCGRLGQLGEMGPDCTRGETSEADRPGIKPETSYAATTQAPTATPNQLSACTNQGARHYRRKHKRT